MWEPLRSYYRPVFAAQTWREAAYLALGLVFGITWFVLVVTLYAVGVGTAVVWVGIPLLMVTQAMLRPIGVIERGMARSLLGAEITTPRPLEIPKPPPGASHPVWSALWLRGHALVHDPHGWRVLLWILVRLVIGPVGFALVIATIAIYFLSVAVPVVTGFAKVEVNGAPIHNVWLWSALGVAAFVLLAPGFAWGIRGLAALHRLLAAWALGPGGYEVDEAALARASYAEEQVRIDQELHDSIGHMISMIVVQAGAGAHVFEKDPRFAREALGNIEERGRAALGELDRIIARIRGDHVETHAPLPGAQDLPELIAGARDAGMTVNSRIDLGDVPPALGRGVYRVVQEALTNAAKHAPGGAVEVEIAQAEDAIAVSIVNALNGGAVQRSSRGNGLASIRDRVTLMGGQATIGQTPQAEFAVRAVLPLEAMLPPGQMTCKLTPSCTCLGCSIRRRVLA